MSIHKSDIEIAQASKMLPIGQIAEKLSLSKDDLILYGEYKAKVKISAINRILSNENSGHLILVSAMTPTPAGEGKTMTSIGLAQAMNKIGKQTTVALREPSLGPVLGKKGGAAGGGYSQVLPMEDINLHFTGDLHAVGVAHNFIAAAIDNHLYHYNKLNIDPRRIEFKRVIDMNDRALRNLVIGLGGQKNGYPRESGFDITAASEIMAILCLSLSYSQLKEKIGNIFIGYTFDHKPVFVKELKIEGAVTALLKEALLPNLVQTIENTPAFVHGGPFANIAQGTNSILATKLALHTSDYVVTEAGFGFDLGAEKFFDIVSSYGNYCPHATVLVVTARALKMHGGKSIRLLNENDPEAVWAGRGNLAKHIENMKKFGMQSIVAINKFVNDSPEELEMVKKICEENDVAYDIVDYWAQGSSGGLDLAKKVVNMIDSSKCHFVKMYEWDESIEIKIEKIAKNIYGAKAIDYTNTAKKNIRSIKKLGFDKLPVCIAKTQKSLSDNPKLLGLPKDFLITVRGVIISSGAGFLVPLTGDILRMPGLPKVPAAEQIDIDDEGNISGLF
ncbi:formate--tetrahydrofolate ligase [bacterium]|nr:formate--tetrahydrofolate ligase [bacterium]